MYVYMYVHIYVYVWRSHAYTPCIVIMQCIHAYIQDIDPFGVGVSIHICSCVCEWRVCMHVCVQACIQYMITNIHATHTHTNKYVWTHLLQIGLYSYILRMCIHTCIQVSRHRCIHTYTRTYIHICIHTLAPNWSMYAYNAYVHTNMHTFVCTYMYAYTYTHACTHTHT